MSERSPWYCQSAVKLNGDTPLGAALVRLLSKLAVAGEPMPSNVALGTALNCSPDSLTRMLMMLEREGVLVIEKRGKTCGLQRRVTIVATNRSTAPIEDRVPRHIERMTYIPHSVPKSLPVPEELRVERDRCPLCELPPHHEECRHGWNGLTTRVQRRAIASELGLAA